MSKFGRATGKTGPGNKAVLPPPAAPPKSGNLPVPPSAYPGGRGRTSVTPKQGPQIVKRWK